jgi:alpha-D-ribose 1-methylphosphonate 5-triphosphate synthase subunit PhnG
MEPSDQVKMMAVRLKIAFLILALLASSSSMAEAQKRQTKQTKPQTELARLREEYIQATKDYKASLGRLIALYERDVTRAETQLTQARALFEQGLISKTELNKSEVSLAAARGKVTETSRSMGNADTQIAETLLEAQAEQQIAKTRLAKGSLFRTASYTRYAGASGWLLSDAWKVQQFYLESFKKQLPVAVFGQGAIHDRWRLDHRNSMDISLHPDGPEGQALLNFLRSNGIPFLAFRSAIPGTATGPHIHIGRPSHRY